MIWSLQNGVHAKDNNNNNNNCQPIALRRATAAGKKVVNTGSFSQHDLCWKRRISTRSSRKLKRPLLNEGSPNRSAVTPRGACGGSTWKKAAAGRQRKRAALESRLDGVNAVIPGLGKLLSKCNLDTGSTSKDFVICPPWPEKMGGQDIHELLDTL